MRSLPLTSDLLLGINYFDTAEVYNNGQSELEVGRIIKELGWRRDEITVATKIYFGTGRKAPNTFGLSRKHIIEGTQASLKRLQLDHVDIVHAHRDDPNVSIREIVEAFTFVINQGWAHYWGTSEWSAARITEALELCEKHPHLAPPCVEQPEYSLIKREKVEREYAPVFAKSGYGTTVWSPLAQGILTGKYNEGVPTGSRFDTLKDQMKSQIDELQTDAGKAKIEKVRALTKIAERFNTSTASLALAWTAKQPNVSTVILGATKPEQLLENLKAVEVFAKLDETTIKEIDKIFAY